MVHYPCPPHKQGAYRDSGHVLPIAEQLAKETGSSTLLPEDVYTSALLMHIGAIALQRGGVGYYKASDFVHMDTGRVRTW